MGFSFFWYNEHMIKIVGNEIWRGGEKIGWIEDAVHVRAHDGTKMGHFEDKFIYDKEGKKAAYIEGDFLFAEGGNAETKIPLDKVAEDIVGGVIPDGVRAAIYVLLGS
jgi:hypothetical protein